MGLEFRLKYILHYCMVTLKLWHYCYCHRNLYSIIVVMILHDRRKRSCASLAPIQKEGMNIYLLTTGILNFDFFWNKILILSQILCFSPLALIHNVWHMLDHQIYTYLFVLHLSIIILWGIVRNACQFFSGKQRTEANYSNILMQWTRLLQF